MTAHELAALHALCFEDGPRPWSVAEFASFLASPTEHVLTAPGALAVIRVVLGEAELLTICVDPAQRGGGRGRAMLAQAMQASQDRGAVSMFLEVAADNGPARALYAQAGFVLSGQRKGYYRRKSGPVDALVLVRALQVAPATPRQG